MIIVDGGLDGGVEPGGWQHFVMSIGRAVEAESSLSTVDILTKVSLAVF